jgi:hypothetical protein
LVDTFISCHLTYLYPDTPGRDYLKGGVVRRLLYLTVLSMLVVAMTASVALAQPQRAPSGADGSYNCADFDTQTQAQNYYEGQGGVSGGDPDGLDADQDGIACETLPPGAEEVTKTFELTLIGEVPEGESFGFSYAAIFPTGEDPSDIVVLCNDSALADSQVPPCESGGVYSESVNFPEGTALSHSFFRDIQQGIEFQSGDEILHSDKVNSASFSFAEDRDGGKPAFPQQPMPEGTVADQYQPSAADQYQPAPVDQAAGDDTAALPDTGGVSLVTIVLITLVTAGLGGLLLRRLLI